MTLGSQILHIVRKLWRLNFRYQLLLIVAFCYIRVYVLHSLLLPAGQKDTPFCFSCSSYSWILSGFISSRGFHHGFSTVVFATVTSLAEIHLQVVALRMALGWKFCQIGLLWSLYNYRCDKFIWVIKKNKEWLLGWSSLVVQWVKELASSLQGLGLLLWHGLDPWPRNFCMLQIRPKIPPNPPKTTAPGSSSPWVLISFKMVVLRLEGSMAGNETLDSHVLF